MKALFILILVVCAAVALWWFRDDITGMRLRFVERESGGARFQAPNWRISADSASAAESHLILKHKRYDSRVFSLTGAYADEHMTSVEREAVLLLSVAAASEMIGVKGTATWTSEPVTIAGRKVRRAAIAFEGLPAPTGVFLAWDDPATKRRWAFVLVDDDSTERERVLAEFISSFTPPRPGTADATKPPASSGRLIFDAPAGWKRVEQTPARTTYVSPDEDAMLELHAPARTSRSTVTKEYAQSQAAVMIKAAGATWQSRAISLKRDAGLGTTVAVVVGTARMGADQRAYEIRLWIDPRTQSLYVASLSALNENTLTKHAAVFDRIRPAADAH